MPDDKIKLVAVSELFTDCSFPMRPDAKAMSDNCRQAATSAVKDSGGVYRYRCEGHKGLLDNGARTKVFTQIPRRKDS